MASALKRCRARRARASVACQRRSKTCSSPESRRKPRHETAHFSRASCILARALRVPHSPRRRRPADAGRGRSTRGLEVEPSARRARARAKRPREPWSSSAQAADLPQAVAHRRATRARITSRSSACPTLDGGVRLIYPDLPDRCAFADRPAMADLHRRAPAGADACGRRRCRRQLDRIAKPLARI